MSLAALSLCPFSAPRSLEEALALLADRHARNERCVPLAGGTDWYVEQHVAPPPAHDAPLPLVVDVSRLAELRGIEVQAGTLRIGAGTTYLELRRNALVLERLPLLAAMAKDVGAIQIQARGTLAGNLASGSPAADGVCALAALDAKIELASVRGRRAITLRDFTTGYRRTVLSSDELITAVEILLPAAGAPFVWRKVGTRQAQSISKVALAGVAEVTGGQLSRLGLGMASVAPTISFLPAVRALGLSRKLRDLGDEEVAAAVQADIAPIDDIRSTAAYRRHVATALVRNFLAAIRETG